MRVIDHTEINDTPMKEKDHPMKEGIPTETEDLQEVGGSQDNGRPPERHGGPPDGGGPPDNGGPPDRNGRPPRCSDRRGPP